LQRKQVRLLRIIGRSLPQLFLSLGVALTFFNDVTQAAPPVQRNRSKLLVKERSKPNSSKPPGAKATGAKVLEGTIREIVISGQRKIEKDAILNRIKSVVGKPLSREQVREDIQNLFKSGFFNDVIVSTSKAGVDPKSNVKPGETDSLKLEYKVVEKPSIGELKFEGINELKTEEVQEASGVKVFEILNQGKIREANEKIQKFYEDKGYFLAKVEFKIEDIKKDESVRVIFTVKENEKVKVKKITILGAKNLTENFLKGRLLTQEEGYFSGLSSSGAYKQEAFDRDMQVLRMLYFSQGYVQAKIDRPMVTVTPDKKGIYITARVEEGEQFEVGEIDFAGDVLFPRDELFETIKIDENKIFAYDVLQKDMSDLTAKYGDLGYAYTNVIPRTRFHDKERKVDLVFEFDKGNKVYFGQINVTGNSKTRDKVLRRELKIHEGELYNETRRRQSLENIQRLGFFDDVNFKTSTPADQPTVMNMEIVVKERNTGQIQLGAGYGTSQGFTLTGSVQQTNFLGRGQNLGVSLNLAPSAGYSSYDLTFTEPYFKDSLWSAGFRIFQSDSTQRADYSERKTGASLFLGHPLGDYLRGNLSYTYVASRLGNMPFLGPDGKQYMTDQTLFPLGSAEGDASQVGGSLEYDTRNDRFKTT
jgi:outer membrane protein insertion porin family